MYTSRLSQYFWTGVLRLTRREFNQLINNYINYLDRKDDCQYIIPDDVCDAVFNFTAGHPQLIRKTLECLKDHVRRNGKDSDMLHHERIQSRD